MTEPTNDQDNASGSRRKDIIRELLQQLGTYTAAITGMVAIVATASLLFDTLFSPISKQEIRTYEQILEVLDINSKNDRDIAIQVRELGKRIDSLSEIEDETKIAIEVQNLKQAHEALVKKYDVIEKAIVQNPERAMSIPLLRRDIDALKTDIKGDLLASRAEIDRVYDQSKWFLGLVATMAIGLIGLAVGNFVRSRSD